jgi:YbgC/YbaW family acyl-CoA thioester hydrolase
MIQNEVERTIMGGDLDALGIVFYPRFYEWIDACGHIFLNKLGLNLDTLWSEQGILFGLGETSCRYHRPGRYLQKVRIVTGIESLDDKRIHLSHRIYLCEDNTLLVDGLEKRICMDVSNPARFHACNIPAGISEILRRTL